MEMDSILRIDEVARVTGLSVRSIWRKVADGIFPKPVCPTSRTRGWRNSEIQQWIASLPHAD